MKKIIYLYRHAGQFYSIEKVFSTVKEYCNDQYQIEDANVPCSGANIIAIIRNLVHAWKLRNSNIHITGDIHYIIFALKRNKCVLTIHDVRLLHLLKGLKRLLFLYFWIKLPIFYAKYITCISETTKEELINITKVSPNKITVIPNPINDEFTYIEHDFEDKCPVILHVGTMENKNLERVCIALKSIQCQLIIIGKLSVKQKQILSSLSLQYINKYDISDHDMVKEFIHADIISFPSLAEGFGMPIIQGQAVGRAVLTSDREPMKGIAGINGAELVNPEDTVSIRNAFLRIIHDSNHRNNLIKNGLINIKRFSGKNIFAQYSQIYNKF